MDEWIIALRFNNDNGGSDDDYCDAVDETCSRRELGYRNWVCGPQCSMEMESRLAA